MTCVREGSHVEMLDADGNVWLQTVETICSGDTIRNPLNGDAITVLTTLSHETGGLWPLVQYMGLTADLAQLVHVPGCDWVTVDDVGTRSIQLCSRIYAIVAVNGKTARIDGVTCCIHLPTDIVNTDTNGSVLRA